MTLKNYKKLTFLFKTQLIFLLLAGCLGSWFIYFHPIELSKYVFENYFYISITIWLLAIFISHWSIWRNNKISISNRKMVNKNYLLSIAFYFHIMGFASPLYFIISSPMNLSVWIIFLFSFLYFGLIIIWFLYNRKNSLVINILTFYKHSNFENGKDYLKQENSKIILEKYALHNSNESISIFNYIFLTQFFLVYALGIILLYLFKINLNILIFVVFCYILINLLFYLLYLFQASKKWVFIKRKKSKKRLIKKHTYFISFLAYYSLLGSIWIVYFLSVTKNLSTPNAFVLGCSLLYFLAWVYMIIKYRKNNILKKIFLFKNIFQ